MFEWFKKQLRDRAIPKWMQQAYDPLFATRDALVNEMLRLETTVDFFVDLQQDLKDIEGKNEKQIIKERWQAMKLDNVIERYQLTISKIKEVLENTPKRPEAPVKYDLQFNHRNDDDF